MPCKASPDLEYPELYQELLLLDDLMLELSGVKDRKFPLSLCQYYYREEIQETVDSATAYVCEQLRAISDRDIEKMSDKLREWWKNHKELDKKRAL